MEQDDKNKRPKAGYEESYDEAVADFEDYQKKMCQSLSKKWSDKPGKAKAVACPLCKKSAPVKKYAVNRTIITRFGEVHVKRNYHLCSCGHGFYPKDIEMGFDDDNLSRDVSKWALDLVCTDTFEASRERMELHHNIKISATKLLHFFQRKSSPLADCEKPEPPVKLPIRKKEKDRAIMMQVDGSMIRQTDGWHEVKLMSIEALGSTKRIYLAETDSIERLESQLRESAGYSRLNKQNVFWICDGARWIWKMKNRLCPQAYELLDFYHVMEHAHEAAKESYGEKSDTATCFTDCFSQHLLSGETEEAFDLVKEHIPYKPRKTIDKLRAKQFGNLLKYLESNSGRLNYAEFLKRGWPIGSGAIESAHKFVLQKRMKMSGMMWSKANVQRMATMRALRSTVGTKNFAETLEKVYLRAA